MTDAIFQRFAALRGKYPDDIAAIEAEEKRVSALLQRKEYASLPLTQELVALCRKDIVWARLRLATDRRLDAQARTELWAEVDAKSWFLKQVAVDFDSSLSQIESELQAELER